MKQKFLSGDMLAITFPRGLTIVILAEDLDYAKPCMVAVSVALMSEQHLSTNFNLYIHQDVTEVRLANENEGMKLFSLMRKIGITVPRKEVKEEKTWAPKDGDFCYITDADTIFISNGNIHSETEWALFHVFISRARKLQLANPINDVGLGFAKHRIATESEKQRLMDAISKKGLVWNPTLKRIENKLWRAEKGGAYWYSSCAPETGKGTFFPEMEHDTYTKFDDAQYLCGDYSKTPDECQLLCDSLNAVLSDNLEKRKLVK